MSPMLTKVVSEQQGFPRVSGDEPVSLRGRETWQSFSPRERG